MLTKEDYLHIIKKALVREGIIKSYSHKPHLAEMPYDRNSRELAELGARYMKLKEKEQYYFNQIEKDKNEVITLQQKIADTQRKMKQINEETMVYEDNWDKWRVLNKQMGNAKGDDIYDLIHEFEAVEGYHKGLAKRLWKINEWWHNYTPPEKRFDGPEYRGYEYLANKRGQSKYGLATDEQKKYIKETVAEMKRVNDMTRFKNTINPDWINRVESLASDNYGKGGNELQEVNKWLDNHKEEYTSLKHENIKIHNNEYNPLCQEWNYLTGYSQSGNNQNDYYSYYHADKLKDYAEERGRTSARFNFVTGNNSNSFKEIEDYIKKENLKNYVDDEGNLTDKWYSEHGVD